MLIKRTKPGQEPYWTAPGGDVEDSDSSIEAALYRELSEELGAEAAGASQVFLFSSPSDAGSSWAIDIGPVSSTSLCDEPPSRVTDRQ